MATITRDAPYGNILSLNAAAAPANGDAMHFVEELPSEATLTVSKSATPTFSCVLEGSADGTTWTTLATLTDVGVASAATTVPYLRARLASISGGGSVTAYVSAATSGTPGAAGPTGPAGPPSSTVFVTADPSGAPAAGSEVQFNKTNNTLWVWNSTATAWKGVVLA